jgi:hypothetical protein
MDYSAANLKQPLSFYVEKRNGITPAEILVKEWNCEQDHIMKTAIPIYLKDKGKPKVIGTGILLTADKRFFLVTAAHILDKRPIGIVGSPIPEKPRLFVTMKADGVSKKERLNDKLDFGWLELSEESAFEITAHKRAIHFRECNLNDSFGASWVTAAGYRGKQKNYEDAFSLKCTCLTSNEVDLTQYEEHGFNPRDHILFKADGRLIRSDGVVIQSTRKYFKGMSGGPIWDVPTLQEHLLSEKGLRFRGIVIGGSNGIIHGTNAATIWGAIGVHA